MTTQQHFIPARHKPSWQPTEKHSGVDFCAIEGCGLLTMHKERRHWFSAVLRAHRASVKTAVAYNGSKKLVQKMKELGDVIHKESQD